jgi:hypothetical protein
MLGRNARDAEAGCFWGVGRAEMTRGTKTVAWALARASYAPQYWKSTASFNRRKFCCHPQPTLVPRVRNARGTFLAVSWGGDAGLLVCPRHGFSEVYWEFARAEAEATGGFLASIQYLGCFWGRAGQECPGYVFGRGVGGRCRFTGVSPARVFRVVMGGGPG